MEQIVKPIKKIEMKPTEQIFNIEPVIDGINEYFNIIGIEPVDIKEIIEPLNLEVNINLDIWNLNLYSYYDLSLFMDMEYENFIESLNMEIIEDVFQIDIETIRENIYNDPEINKQFQTTIKKVIYEFYDIEETMYLEEFIESFIQNHYYAVHTPTYTHYVYYEILPDYAKYSHNMDISASLNEYISELNTNNFNIELIETISTTIYEKLHAYIYIGICENIQNQINAANTKAGTAYKIHTDQINQY